MNKLKISDILKICALPFVVFIVAYSFNLLYKNYNILSLLNILFHFVGGFSMAVSGFLILGLGKRFNLIKTKGLFIDFILIITFVMSVAVLWEFYEFISDAYGFSHSQISNSDTMQDLFMGMMGAVSFCLFRLAKRNI